MDEMFKKSWSVDLYALIQNPNPLIRSILVAGHQFSFKFYEFTHQLMNSSETNVQVLDDFKGTFEDLLDLVRISTCRVIVINACNTSFYLKNSYIKKLESATNASTYFVFLNRVYTKQERSETPKTYYLFENELREYIYRQPYLGYCED